MGFEDGVGPGEHAFQRIGAGLPIERELQALVEEDRRIARVEHSAAPVFGRAVESSHKLPVCRPYGDAAREVVVLGNPHTAQRIDRETIGMVYMERVVGAGRGRSRAADASHEPAVGVEDLDLMRLAAVADEPLAWSAAGNVPRIFQSVFDQDATGLGRQRVEPHEPVPAEHEQAALLVQRDAAWARYRAPAGERARLRVDQQQLVLPQHRAHERPVVSRNGREHELAIAAFKILQQLRSRIGRLLRTRIIAELGLEDRLIAERPRLRREPQLALPHRAHVTEMLGHGVLAQIDGQRRRSGPGPADPMLAADLRAVLAQPLQAVSALGDIAPHEDERLAVGRPRAGHDGHARRRRMRREPAAGVVGRAPGGLARVVDAELVPQLQRLAPQPAHDVIARRDRPRGDVIQAVPGGVGVAQQVVAAVPPGDVVPGGEGRFADQVPHPLSLLVLDDERHQSRFGQPESHRDRRRFRDGLGQDEARQFRAA